MYPFHRPHRLACWIIVLGSAVADLAMADIANRTETLRGHKSVFVSVTTPDTDDATKTLRLVRTSLERFVLDRLTKAGLTASSQFVDQTLILEINVDVHRLTTTTAQDVFAFVSQFEASQAAKLATNRQSALVVTWRATRFGAVTKAEADVLRTSVVDNLEQFITDWQTAQQPPSVE